MSCILISFISSECQDAQWYSYKILKSISGQVCNRDDVVSYINKGSLLLRMLVLAHVFQTVMNLSFFVILYQNAKHVAIMYKYNFIQSQFMLVTLGIIIYALMDADLSGVKCQNDGISTNMNKFKSMLKFGWIESLFHFLIQVLVLVDFCIKYRHQLFKI
jgi:hypothetical protein